MLKTLIKKQLLEINKAFFVDQVTGKALSKRKSAVKISLFVLLMVFVSMIFVAPASLMCKPFCEANISWIYFTIMGGIAIFFGVFGSVFNTYSSLYKTKDNDLLISMPIPVKNIIVSRLMGVYLMGLLYTSMVMIPTLIIYFINGKPSFASVICSIILYFLITVFVLFLSCILGYLVAKLTTKLKNKSIITVVISLAFFILYYYIFFQANKVIEDIIANSQKYADSIKVYAYPFYLMGKMGTGDILASLVLTIAVIGIFALEYVIISRSFLKLVITSSGTKKQVKKEFDVKSSNVEVSLLKRELKHFISSPVYMLNCGLGTILIAAMGIYAIVKRNSVNEIIPEGLNKEMIIGILMIGISALATMNDLTAPSISLEGKNLWIVRTLPINTFDIIKAKINMHMLLTVPELIFTSICLCACFNLEWYYYFAITFTGIIFVLLVALIGIMLNLVSPNLNWTNEIVVAKQSMSVMVTLFGGWIYLLVYVGLYFLFARINASSAVLFIYPIVNIVLCVILIYVLKTWGVKKLEDLKV